MKWIIEGFRRGKESKTFLTLDEEARRSEANMKRFEFECLLKQFDKRIRDCETRLNQLQCKHEFSYKSYTETTLSETVITTSVLIKCECKRCGLTKFKPLTSFTPDELQAFVTLGIIKESDLPKQDKKCQRRPKA